MHVSTDSIILATTQMYVTAVETIKQERNLKAIQPIALNMNAKLTDLKGALNHCIGQLNEVLK